MEAVKISEVIKLTGEELADKLWADVHEKVPVDRSDSEYRSWKQSLPKLIKVVNDAGLGNLMLAAEYKLPTGGRIDAMLLGYSAAEHTPLAVIVEIKQWSKEKIAIKDRGFTVIHVQNDGQGYPSIHPICQTNEYIKYMNRNHGSVLDGNLSVTACQYLFNFDATYKEELFEGDFGKYRHDQDKMFCMGEEGRFHEFLKHLFSDEEKDCSEAVSVLFEDNYRITDLDMEVFKDITNRPESIRLIEDQINCMECVNMSIDRLLAGTLDRKQMFIVTGAAGTGKTIVGFKLISDYCQAVRERRLNTEYKCAYTLPRSRTIKAVLDGIGGGLQTVFLNNLKGSFELLVVDEAHRVTDFDRKKGGTGHILNQANIVVVLQDDNQRVLGNEIGTLDNYRRFAKENGFTVQIFGLKLQKRAGFGGYVDHIDRLIYGGEAISCPKDNGLQIQVCETLKDMETAVSERHQSENSIKYYASYCWEWKSRNDSNAVDISITEGDYTFQKQWNPYTAEEQFRWYTDSIDKVGCIYTAQGLGYDYIALIWWDDLRWDCTQNKWIVNLDKVTRFDSQLRSTIRNHSVNYDYLMKNIYRVLLTRAKKGIYIWFKDQDTKKHFEEVVLPGNA
ncbi:DUF2075 domain-containing protein [Lachnoclostridium pacaense]|uniref:DNA/RNA helicase domain-containing protein n=1 Tax=Enterocloster hominis (ex Hitch et al. 2024) TaxID=1917870 RepID=UPI001D10F460|nr:DNA/RNA helicase domain-containing protein [Lachnoclostridium pacaense]MCC2876609.1 DUF2075 domain-containing protein [Lachnoclostridium pacaense]